MMKEGVEVEWVTSRRLMNGGIKFTQKTGRVIEVDGDVVIVKPRKGLPLTMLASSLHVSGSGPNQLTQALLDAI
jgi:hypothetical protein